MAQRKQKRLLDLTGGCSRLSWLGGDTQGTLQEVTRPRKSPLTLTSLSVQASQTACSSRSIQLNVQYS